MNLTNRSRVNLRHSIANCPNCGGDHVGLLVHKGHEGGRGDYAFCPETLAAFTLDGKIANREECGWCIHFVDEHDSATGECLVKNSTFGPCPCCAWVTHGDRYL